MLKFKNWYFYYIFISILGACASPVKDKNVKQISKYILPDTSLIPRSKTGDEIRYGLELFTRTAYYLGPEGKVMALAGNKMNCKNCHLDNGMRTMSNSLIETYLKYPQYRAREGMVLTVEDRINNCFERPMNGKILPYNSREMRALVAYMRWLCEGKKASYEDDSLHLGKIGLLHREANITNGAKIYDNKCQSCHGSDGQGEFTANKETYKYPPLWGKYSYAQGSSMHRLITASRFVKWSMPYVDHKTAPQLSDEEVFDVVAFINCDSIHPRPKRNLQVDCPDLLTKPIDFPEGPFLDSFPARQHRLGPYQPIKDYYERLKKSKS